MSDEQQKHLSIRAWSLILAISFALAFVSGFAVILVSDREPSSIGIFQVTRERSQLHVLVRFRIGGPYAYSVVPDEESLSGMWVPVIEVLSGGHWQALPQDRPRRSEYSFCRKSDYAVSLRCRCPADPVPLLIKISCHGVSSDAFAVPAITRPP